MKKPSQDLVKAFLDWYRASEHSKNEDYYSATVTLEALQSLPREQFIEFFFQFAKNGGMVQSGGPRTASRFRQIVENKYDAFRAFTLEPFSEQFDEIDWLTRTENFAGFGQGLATIYLNRVNKKRFAIINNKAVDAVGLFGIHVPTALARRYSVIRDAEAQLIEWFPEFDNLFRADALSQFLIGEESGKPWAEHLREGSEIRSWIYAAGEQARLWEQYRVEGVMGIGWNDIKRDLSSVTSEESLRQLYNEAYGDRATDADFRQLCDFVLKMHEGDRVFVKRGIGQLVGYGEVVSDYFYDSSRDEYRHLRKTQWKKHGEWNIPDSDKGLPQKTLTEIKDPERRTALLALIGETEVTEVGEALFGKKAFDLLAELRVHPFVSYYTERGDDFKDEVEEPLHRLMADVERALPSSITDSMETKKRIFSRIPKNDYGRGGAWDFYWGAFYPKDGKRTADPQLYVFISPDILGFGFYVGQYGMISQRRFTKNCAEHGAVLKQLLEPTLLLEDLVFGEPSNTSDSAREEAELNSPTWDEWTSNPEKYGIRACIEVPTAEVITLSEGALVERVSKVFRNVFPLLLLAQYDEPVEPILRYLDEGEPVDAERNPPYALDQFAADVHLGRGEIDRWLRAIKRKRQVIFYGPPGTGKTFVAQHLARAVIAGGDGFCEMLQFHPSYAYEDFMQGLRPKALKAGGLEYAMVPGRFRDFCARASECKDSCVLIIDEINRANLARVFGELMYLLEYREESMPLAGGERFRIPANAIIIGTMNTADRSIALVDHAFRRRFAFLGLYPNYDILRKYHEGHEFNPEKLIEVLDQINSAIGDKHYSIGVSFFLDQDIKRNMEDVWEMEIEPYIEELFFDQTEKAANFVWSKIRDRIGIS